MSFGNGWFDVLQGHGDVDKTRPTDGQVLKWSAALNMWVPQAGGGVETDPLSWHISDDQTLLTGDKSGSFDLTTTGTIATKYFTATSTGNPVAGLEYLASSDWQGQFASDAIPVSMRGYLKNTGTNAFGTLGHGIGVLGWSEDIASSQFPLYGVEGRVDGRSNDSDAVYAGTLGLVDFRGAAYTNGFAKGVEGRVQITTDGSTPLAEGVAVSFYAPTIIGGGTKYSFFGSNPTRIDLDGIGTTLTAGTILQNDATGSVQISPALKFTGNSRAVGADYPIDWYFSTSDIRGVGGFDFDLRCKIPSLAVDNTVMSFFYDGSVSFLGSISAKYKASDGTAAVADGTYTVGNKITPVTGNNGTITIKDGIITAIQQAT